MFAMAEGFKECRMGKVHINEPSLGFCFAKPQDAM